MDLHHYVRVFEHLTKLTDVHIYNDPKFEIKPTPFDVVLEMIRICENLENLSYSMDPEIDSSKFLQMVNAVGDGRKQLKYHLRKHWKHVNIPQNLVDKHKDKLCLVHHPDIV